MHRQRGENVASLHAAERQAGLLQRLLLGKTWPGLPETEGIHT